uniref:Uncharacterized protein n=1 Tax=Arundo donax TaxID=35708 RepID=A0A0A9BKZ6_ARUDO
MVKTGAEDDRSCVLVPWLYQVVWLYGVSVFFALVVIS